MPQQPMRLAASILAALLIGIALPAHASKEATQKAKRHFKAAQKAYSSADYKASLSSFEKAYALRPLPGFLFNMAQCLTKLEQPAKAHALYTKYLQEHPKAYNRAIVESLMAESKQKMEASRALAAEEAKVKLPPPPPPAPGPTPKVVQQAPVPNQGKAVIPVESVPPSTAQARAKAVVQAPRKAASTPKKPSTPVRADKPATQLAGDMALELVPIIPKVTPPAPTSDSLKSKTKAELPLVNIAKLTDPKAIYEEWWFWSVAGSVVAASVGAILYANHSTEDVVVLPSGTLGRVDQR